MHEVIDAMFERNVSIQLERKQSYCSTKNGVKYFFCLVSLRNIFVN